MLISGRVQIYSLKLGIFDFDPKKIQATFGPKVQLKKSSIPLSPPEDGGSVSPPGGSRSWQMLTLMEKKSAFDTYIENHMQKTWHFVHLNCLVRDFLNNFG